LTPRPAELSANPVTLPPGRARLATRPVTSGSVVPAMTIGTVGVAVFAACTPVFGPTTMTSDPARSNSSIIAG
jgi:hypothetical protein